ncbi:MAG: glycosyltransferase family 2 protein [Chloroflexi bacterium]|nr:glycosyltransferase family 2 protein [Chloroflexota bacterium]
MTAPHTPGCPRVALVVVTWNNLRDTLVCLQSIRTQTFANIQVVLVDNASQDSTVEVVERYFPEVYVIANATNTGYVHANNQGVRWALDHGANWVLLLNNDVWLHPESVAEMVRVGENRPEVGVVGPVMQRTLRPDIHDLGGDLDFRWGRVLLRHRTPALNGHDTFPIDYVWGCTLMARREIWEQVGGLVAVYVAYFEDAELCLRAKRLGYDTVTALGAQVRHQVGLSGEKRFAWQTYLRMRNHALFFLRLGRPQHWPTLVPSLFLVQLPLIFARSARVFLARKLRRRKYAERPITLWGYEEQIVPPTQDQIARWLDEAGYAAH